MAYPKGTNKAKNERIIELARKRLPSNPALSKGSIANLTLGRERSGNRKRTLFGHTFQFMLIYARVLGVFTDAVI